jgi:hypothetical protein
MDIKSYMMKSMMEAFVMWAGKDILWYEYKEEEQVTHCGVCNIPLKKDDKSRPFDCEHVFHADCICRYSDRVENCCVSYLLTNAKFQSIK